jgi:thymidylate synthase (FAD)
MQVKILNPERTQEIFKSWGEFATTCYNTPKEFSEKVGRGCFNNSHFSGSRTEYIKFEITGIDRGVAEQAMRHEIGVRCQPFIENTYDENPENIIKNMQSFRYVDKDDFEYVTPNRILYNAEACRIYKNAMMEINKARKEIVKALLTEGVDSGVAVEEANYIIPRGATTALTIAFTPEALIHYMHKRLCKRAQYFHRVLALEMKKEVEKVIPDLAERLVPECEFLLWCPEGKKSCGAKPNREELEYLLNNRRD